MKIKLFFALLAISSQSLLLFAQTAVHIKGKIYNTKDSSVVAFAVIGINQTHGICQSGLDGSFDLQLSAGAYQPSDTVDINCLGYEKYTILLKDASGNRLAVYLTPMEFQIGEAYKTDYTIKTIMKKAEDNIPNNYPSGAFTMSAFYRQYHKENGKYVRLIESDLDIYNEPMASATSASQKELIRLKHVRRSVNYEENKEQHGDHLMDILAENPVRYVIGTVLNSKAYDYYRFHIEQTTTDSMTGRNRYYLSYISKPGSSGRKERGEIVIAGETFAIVYIKIIEERDPYNERDRRLNSGPYDWKFVNGIYEAHYEEQPDGKYYPAELFKSYLHELVNNRFRTVDYTVEENFHLIYDVLSYAEVKSSSLKKNFHTTTNLYYHKYQYDKDFWKNYKIADSHFPLADISKDLSIKKSLEEQFVEAGK